METKTETVELVEEKKLLDIRERKENARGHRYRVPWKRAISPKAEALSPRPGISQNLRSKLGLQRPVIQRRNWSKDADPYDRKKGASLTKSFVYESRDELDLKFDKNSSIHCQKVKDTTTVTNKKAWTHKKNVLAVPLSENPTPDSKQHEVVLNSTASFPFDLLSCLGYETIIR
ncbi:hypothetical protein TNCV_483901 [Trichonephila clavipes]|nr:hypothetical protein TNCV_483901 [Trichonephila clavipes]